MLSFGDYLGIAGLVLAVATALDNGMLERDKLRLAAYLVNRPHSGFPQFERALTQSLMKPLLTPAGDVSGLGVLIYSLVGSTAIATLQVANELRSYSDPSLNSYGFVTVLLAIGSRALIYTSLCFALDFYAVWIVKRLFLDRDYPAGQFPLLWVASFLLALGAPLMWLLVATAMELPPDFFSANAATLAAQDGRVYWPPPPIVPTVLSLLSTPFAANLLLVVLVSVYQLTSLVSGSLIRLLLWSISAGFSVAIRRSAFERYPLTLLTLVSIFGVFALAGLARLASRGAA